MLCTEHIKAVQNIREICSNSENHLNRRGVQHATVLAEMKCDSGCTSSDKDGNIIFSLRAYDLLRYAEYLTQLFFCHTDITNQENIYIWTRRTSQSSCILFDYRSYLCAMRQGRDKALGWLNKSDVHGERITKPQNPITEPPARKAPSTFRKSLSRCPVKASRRS